MCVSYYQCIIAVLRAVKADGLNTRSKRQASTSSVRANIEIAAMADLTIWEYHKRAENDDEDSAILHLLTYFSHMFNLVCASLQ